MQVVAQDRQGHSEQPRQAAQPHAREHAPQQWDDEAEREEEAVDPLSHADAVTLFGEQALRPSSMTPGRVVLVQIAITVLSAIAWAVFSSERAPSAWSAFFGGAVCFVPSGVFAFRLWLARERASISGLVVGEAIKVF